MLKCAVHGLVYSRNRPEVRDGKWSGWIVKDSGQLANGNWWVAIHCEPFFTKTFTNVRAFDTVPPTLGSSGDLRPTLAAPRRGQAIVNDNVVMRQAPIPADDPLANAFAVPNPPQWDRGDAPLLREGERVARTVEQQNEILSQRREELWDRALTWSFMPNGDTAFPEAQNRRAFGTMAHDCFTNELVGKDGDAYSYLKEQDEQPNHRPAMPQFFWLEIMGSDEQRLPANIFHMAGFARASWAGGMESAYVRYSGLIRYLTDQHAIITLAAAVHADIRTSIKTALMGLVGAMRAPEESQRQLMMWAQELFPNFRSRVTGDDGATVEIEEIAMDSAYDAYRHTLGRVMVAM